MADITAEEFSVLQQQVETLSKEFGEFKGSLNPILTFVEKAAKEDELKTEKQKKEEDEQKMLKRFVRMLKEEGVVFARKQQGAGKVETAPGQATKEPVKAPESQQAVIQGQAAKNEEEPEEYPEEKAEKPEEEEEKQVKPEEEEEEEKAEKPGEYPEAAKKEIATLKSQLEGQTASISQQIDKAVEKRMQEVGFKQIGRTPVRAVGAEEVMILKGDKPVKREDLIQELMKLPLAQLNDMHWKSTAGLLQMPEVT